MNTSYIVRNIKAVLESGNIHKLTKASYHFITLYLGFIAHYDLYGFRSTYSNTEPSEFARLLLSGEYRGDIGFNWRYAQRRAKYNPDYSGTPEYQASVHATMVAVLTLAQSYLDNSDLTCDNSDIEIKE